MHIFPNEISEEIARNLLLHLDDMDDIRSACLVSNGWYSIIRTSWIMEIEQSNEFLQYVTETLGIRKGLIPLASRVNSKAKSTVPLLLPNIVQLVHEQKRCIFAKLTTLSPTELDNAKREISLLRNLPRSCSNIFNLITAFRVHSREIEFETDLQKALRRISDLLIKRGYFDNAVRFTMLMQDALERTTIISTISSQSSPASKLRYIYKTIENAVQIKKEIKGKTKGESKRVEILKKTSQELREIYKSYVNQSAKDTAAQIIEKIPYKSDDDKATYKTLIKPPITTTHSHNLQTSQKIRSQAIGLMMQGSLDDAQGLETHTSNAIEIAETIPDYIMKAATIEDILKMGSLATSRDTQATAIDLLKMGHFDDTAVTEALELAETIPDELIKKSTIKEIFRITEEKATQNEKDLETQFQKLTLSTSIEEPERSHEEDHHEATRETVNVKKPHQPLPRSTKTNTKGIDCKGCNVQ